MSRIGKIPVEIPAGIDVKLDGACATFKKGSVEKVLDTRDEVLVSLKDGSLHFSSRSDDRKDLAYWGLYRTLANNIIIGLTEGFEKKLEINGVGYRAAVKENVLELQLGFSHPVNYEFPKDINITVEKNIISIKGDDKQVVGQIAAEIRGFRPPEPYKGKGVKYVEERII
ncbi:MAG: 50S ribosomal protein L6, partial [Campylobacteraceae bacterium]|nr:50S ribosomal protein L6 [Campylobacteraceae bacterium]